MTNILANLKSLKEKINNLEETFSEKIEQEDLEQKRKDRIINKTKEFLSNQSDIVTLNIGGEIDIQTTVSTIQNFNYQLNLKSKVTKPNIRVLVDCSKLIFNTILDIIRLNLDEATFKEKKILLTEVEIPLIKASAKSFFKSDTEKVLNLFEFKYSSRVARLKELQEEIEKKVEENTKFWPKTTKISCYQCGKQNTGSDLFNRIKYSNPKRNDNFVIGGYFATCTKCDPNAKKKY